jgi:hypothetical protein
MYSVSCKYSGELQIVIDTDYDMEVFLSTDTGFNSMGGFPPSFVESAISPDAEITHKVKAGVTYYLWVKSASVYSKSQYKMYIYPH